MVRSTEVAMTAEDRKWGASFFYFPPEVLKSAVPKHAKGQYFLSEDLAVQYAKERAAAMFKETEAS